ncbi:MAG: hypothetical protein O3B86_10735, partial [Planctomycetota bacterium]|nr:hypothetical protein [Planctomycetota bacterium]
TKPCTGIAGTPYEAQYPPGAFWTKPPDEPPELPPLEPPELPERITNPPDEPPLEPPDEPPLDPPRTPNKSSAKLGVVSNPTIATATVAAAASFLPLNQNIVTILLSD